MEIFYLFVYRFCCCDDCINNFFRLIGQWTVVINGNRSFFKCQSFFCSNRYWISDFCIRDPYKSVLKNRGSFLFEVYGKCVSFFIFRRISFEPSVFRKREFIIINRIFIRLISYRSRSTRIIWSKSIR